MMHKVSLIHKGSSGLTKQINDPGLFVAGLHIRVSMSVAL